MLQQIIQGIANALLAFLEKRANTPTVGQDAQTPKTIRDKCTASLREWLQKQQGGVR